MIRCLVKYSSIQMFDYSKIIDMKEFSMDSINYLGWKWNYLSIRLPRLLYAVNAISKNKNKITNI